MKKLKLYVVFLVLIVCSYIPLNAQSSDQSLPKPTTEEEYNYLSKGYKIQIESGLDMKKGYSFIDLSPENGFGLSFKDSQKGTITRTIKYKALMRDGEDKPCAILCILERKDTGYKNYICIPTLTSPIEMWKKTKESFEGLTDEWKDVNMMALSQLASILSFFSDISDLSD